MALFFKSLHLLCFNSLSASLPKFCAPPLQGHPIVTAWQRKCRPYRTVGGAITRPSGAAVLGDGLIYRG